MSIVKIPDGFKPLRQTCGVLIDVETVCTEGLTLIKELVWGSVAAVADYNWYVADYFGGGGEDRPNSLYNYPIATVFESGSDIGWTNDVGDFLISRIEISMLQEDPPIYLGSGLEDVDQGIGAIPCWELCTNAPDVEMIDCLLTFKVGNELSAQRCMFDGFVEGQTWWDDGNNTRQTPYGFVLEASDIGERFVANGIYIGFSLSIFNPPGGDCFELIAYSPMRIRIYGTPA